MAKHLFLPKVFTGANIDEPVANAVWEDKGKKILASISDGIELDESAYTRGVSSIPDIYARPLTFLGALKNEQHPLRKRVLQEWRGLISLLALHAVKPDLNGLTITPVSLDGGKLGKAMENLAPRPIQLQQNGPRYEWTDLLIIKYKDIPIGAFSPATLVYTSADYCSELEKHTFLLKDDLGYLRPPTDKGDLEYVGEWLEWFVRHFNQYANNRESDTNKDYVYAGDLNRLFDVWIAEIRQELGSKGPMDASRVKVADETSEVASSSFLPRYEIYKLLLTPLVWDTSYAMAEHKSEYALNPSRNESGYVEVVLITPGLLSQDKDLWKGTRPSGLNEDTTSLVNTFFKESWGTRINNIDLRQDRAVWVRPELYFLTDVLTKAQNGEILPDDNRYLNGDNVDYLLPFRKEILQFFSPEAIKETLRPRFDIREDFVEFKFNLPLATGTPIEIKKRYKTKGIGPGDGQIREIDVPVLEIFPNYLGDFWCQYFMLFGGNDSLKATPVNFGSKIEIEHKEQVKRYDNQPSVKAEIFRITGYNSFPEAVSISSSGANAGDLGILLLNKDESMRTKSFTERCTIGIDFGTSNTNVYKKKDDNAKRLSFHFKDHLRKLLNSGNPVRENLTQLFFIPGTYQELPIPTALRIFNGAIMDRLLLDYFIYFPNEYKYPDNVHTNLRWEDDNLKVDAFLNALVFLLLIDVVRDRYSEINFRCTFPKSFSDDRKSAYERSWEKALASIFHKANGDARIAGNQFIYVENLDDEWEEEYRATIGSNGSLTINVKPHFRTEGVAAGEYFSSRIVSDAGKSKADKVRGAICIDVGGGTTDYSIWFGNKIAFDTSVLLAGRQLSKLIQDNSRIRDVLFSEEAQKALGEAKGNDVQFASRLNFILKKEEKEITDRLSKNINNKDIAWLRRVLAIEFGALSFYAGHLCLALNEHLRGELAASVKERGIKLYWGGNAAKLINWIDFGRYVDKGTASTYLNMMFYNVIVDEEIGAKSFDENIASVNQIQSPGHKDEASGGVVFIEVGNEQMEEHVGDASGLSLNQKSGTPGLLEGIVIGEHITIKNGGDLFHYNTIPVGALFDTAGGTNLGKSNLAQIKKFVGYVNEIGKRTGLFPEGYQIHLTPAEFQDIETDVITELTKQASKKPEARTVEPIFILEVKSLLDKLKNKMR